MVSHEHEPFRLEQGTEARRLRYLRGLVDDADVEFGPRVGLGVSDAEERVGACGDTGAADNFLRNGDLSKVEKQAFWA